MNATKKRAWKKFADLLLPLLFTFTELLAITVTTFKPPKNPLITVAIPKDRISLLILDLLFSGYNLSTDLMLSKDYMLAIKVMAITALINS
mgnify:CR=1 FL=1